MQRKKNAKPVKAKNNIKRQPKSVMTPAQVIEKEFNEAPAKLMTQFRKELTALKQQEKKLKSELKKAQVQKKVAKNKRTALVNKTKMNNTAAAKKLLNAAKQHYDQVCSLIQDLSTKCDNLKKQSSLLSEKQSKFTALSKHLKQFEKQWMMKNKKPTTASKTRKKTDKKSKVEADIELTPSQVLTKEIDISNLIPHNEVVEASKS